MIHGIGTDIIDRRRIEYLINNLDDPFFKLIFSRNEYEQGKLEVNPLNYFSGRFAAKEAIFKSLKIKADTLEFSDIEVLRDEKGMPNVRFLKDGSCLIQELGVEKVELSISHEENYTIAYAIAVKAI